jgi:hypothetical protein
VTSTAERVASVVQMATALEELLKMDEKLALVYWGIVIKS